MCHCHWAKEGATKKEGERISSIIRPTNLSIAQIGGVAQMVERSLSMREVPGSIPGASSDTFFNTG